MIFKKKRKTFMEKKITGHTRLICLLGDPVAHSKSPAMHNLAFEALGLDYVYLALECSETQFDRTVEVLRQIRAKGFNCTMPCKRIAAKRCSSLSPAAELMKSVNTVVIGDDGQLIGHNTDGAGYMTALRAAGHSIAGKEITLLGSGGAASALLAQAALDGAAAIHVFAREGNSKRLISEEIERIRRRTDCCVTLNDLSDHQTLKARIGASALLVNASSVGMAPDTDSCLIPDRSFLHPQLVVSDIIYHPQKTKLLLMAEEAELPFFNGIDMLLYQGAEAFRLWTGKEMPVDLIKKEVFS